MARKVLFFKVVSVLLVILLAQAVVNGIIWFRYQEALAILGPRDLGIPTGNFIKTAYPWVDFSQIYPGSSESEIDLIQRETFSLAYVYEPFTGFKIAPAKAMMVEVTPAGFRAGAKPQPWPPDPSAVNVFVLGGSTAFGCAVRNEDTLSAALQEELHKVMPGHRVECYNFGCGYYFSTQERLRFEMLLAAGHKPDFAVFLDGLNDFYYETAEPQFTALLARVFEPKKQTAPPPRPAAEDVAATVRSVLFRYQASVRMTTAMAEHWRVRTVFVGQPVPFFAFPRTMQTHPFPLPSVEHGLAMIAYGQFRERGLAGDFGQKFIWCGDCFGEAKSPMYADGIHYSPEGNRVLARAIVERAMARGLLN